MIFPSSLFIAASLATAALAAPSGTTFQQYLTDIEKMNADITQLCSTFKNFPGTPAGIEVSSCHALTASWYFQLMLES